MNLSENFQQEVTETPINPISRTMGIFTIAAATLLSGCANTNLRLPEGNSGFPVGRVLNQSVNRDWKTGKESIKDSVRGSFRPTACAGGGVAMTAAECPDQQNRGQVMPRPDYRYNR